MMSAEQSNLLQLLQKTGEKRLVIIIITPTYKMFTKRFFARSHYLFIIPSEAKLKGNYALAYKNYTDPVYAEARPYDLKELFEEAEKKRPFNIERKYTSSDCFLDYFKYNWVDKKIYNLYCQIVKDPVRDEVIGSRSIPYQVHMKNWYRFGVLLYNLRKYLKKEGVGYKNMVSDLGFDTFGNKVITEDFIRDMVDSITALKKPPISLKHE